jgi:hypothetical protein
MAVSEAALRSAHAAPPKAAAAPPKAATAPPKAAAAPSNPDSAAQTKELAAAARAAETARNGVVAVRAKVKAMASERRVADAAAQSAQRAVAAHFQQGAAAYKKYADAEKTHKSGAPTTPIAGLELAKGELGAGLEQAASLQKNASTLGALEATLEQQVNDAAQGAANAKASAASAVAAAKKLKASADSATKAALDASQQATSARNESGFASTAAFAALRARRQREATALTASINGAKATLVEVNQAWTKAQAALPKPIDPKAWREIFPEPNRVAVGVRQLSGPEEDALLRKFFPKFMKPNASCPEAWQPGMGHDNDQARAAGMFSPQVTAAVEGAFTHPGAKERLLQVRLCECTGTHVEGYGTGRWILVDGNRTLVNVETFGLTGVGFVEDVDGDGMLDFTQIVSDGHQGMENTSGQLSTFAGGKLHDLQPLSGSSDPCNAGEEMAGHDAERVSTRTLVRNSPKLEFKEEETRSRCF